MLQKAMERLQNNSAVQANISETAFYTIVKVQAPFTIKVTVDEKPATKTRLYVAEGVSRRAPCDDANPKKGYEIAIGRAKKAIALMMTGRDIDHNWRYSGSFTDSEAEMVESRKLRPETTETEIKTVVTNHSSGVSCAGNCKCEPDTDRYPSCE
jgi:hypothetical protein